MKKQDNSGEFVLFPTRIIAIGFTHSGHSVMSQCVGCPLLKSYFEKKGMVFLEKENDFLWKVRLEGGLRAKKYHGSSWWFVVDRDGHEIAFMNMQNSRKSIVPVGYICRPIDVRLVPFGISKACIAFYDDIVFQTNSVLDAIRFLDERLPGWKCPCACTEITRECLTLAFGDEVEKTEWKKPLVLEVGKSLEQCSPEHACHYISRLCRNDDET